VLAVCFTDATDYQKWAAFGEWRLDGADSLIEPGVSTGHYHYYDRFDCCVEHKRLSSVVSRTISKQNVIVAYFSNVAFVDTTRDTSYRHRLTFITAKQILGVLSFHVVAPGSVKNCG
jgi:hypothetical protein